MSAPVRKTTKQEEGKSRKRSRNAQLPSRSASLVISMLPHAGDHTGSRAIGWLTGVDRRTHTCLIDASIYVGFTRSECSHAGERQSERSATGTF